jgi:hypothetical protein
MDHKSLKFTSSNCPGQDVDTLQVRKEVSVLLEQHRGILQPEHFDSGVICHLQKRSEMAAANALREIGRRIDFPAANNKPAYLTHWLMKLAAPEEPSSLRQPGVLSHALLSLCLSDAYRPVQKICTQCAVLVLAANQRQHHASLSQSAYFMTSTQASWPCRSLTA